MIADDIRQAQLNRADKEHVVTLLHVLHHFLRTHPEADRLSTHGASSSDLVPLQGAGDGANGFVNRIEQTAEQGSAARGAWSKTSSSGAVGT